jgi:hypothetical protein
LALNCSPTYADHIRERTAQRHVGTLVAGQGSSVRVYRVAAATTPRRTPEAARICQSNRLWTTGGEQRLIEGPLEFLRPLEVVLVKPRAPEENDFVCHLAHYHYLGFDGASGQNLRYLIRDCYRRQLAFVLFGCAAWKVKARDRFIGWNIEQPQRRRGSLLTTAAF